MQIDVLGATRVHTPGGVLGAGQLAGVKPRQILEILAISGDHPVSKERLADLIWDGHPPKSYLGTLESYVCVLRRALGPCGDHGPCIVTVTQGYQLNPHIQVDLTRFRWLLRAARANADQLAALTLLEEALDLADGDMLEDEPHASWVSEERERFDGERLAAAELAGSLALALGRPEAACRHARTALAQDQLAEVAWRTLMQGLGAAGRRPEALRAYFHIRQLLAEELGSEPSRETTDLYLDLLREDSTAAQHAAETAPEEILLLMSRLREAVFSVPGMDVPREGDAWLQVAADMLRGPRQGSPGGAGDRPRTATCRSSAPPSSARPVLRHAPPTTATA